MKASSVSPFPLLAAVVIAAAAMLAGAPTASAQSSITFTESMVVETEDYSDSVFEPTVIPMPLGAGVNMISGRVAENFISEEIGFDPDYDYFRVLNPELLPIASISIRVTGFTTVEGSPGQFELIGNQIPTFAPGKGGVISQGAGVNGGILLITENGESTLEAFIYDPSILTFALFPPEVGGVGGFDYTVNITALPVPEPSTWALLGSGFVAGALALRRRQRG